MIVRDPTYWNMRKLKTNEFSKKVFVYLNKIHSTTKGKQKEKEEILNKVLTWDTRRQIYIDQRKSSGNLVILRA